MRAKSIPFPLPLSLTRRLWTKIDRSAGPDGCWPWRGWANCDGYGYIWINDEGYRVTRVLYFLTYGTIDDTLLVCHDCDNPRCCNPAHLWQGTIADNHADMCAKGRVAKGDRHGMRAHPETHSRGDQHWARLKPEALARGERNGNTHLTEANVREILAAPKQRGIPTMLSRKFGVSITTICDIRKRKVWGHVEIE